MSTAPGAKPASTAKLREIVFDTETTGTDSRNGDRVIEVGCIELIDRRPTGREFHKFVQPDRKIHPDAIRVHGITDEMLTGKQRFAEIADEFLAFIGDAPLIAHNASFDMNFINMELGKCGRGSLEASRAIDTLALARKKFPAGPNSLDALCRRFGIDMSKRDKHGAIIDSLLLSQVYIELIGEKQASLGFAGDGGSANALITGKRAPAKKRASPLPSRLTDADRARHAEFVATLGDKAAWKRFSW